MYALVLECEGANAPMNGIPQIYRRRAPIADFARISSSNAESNITLSSVSSISTSCCEQEVNFGKEGTLFNNKNTTNSDKAGVEKMAGLPILGKI